MSSYVESKSKTLLEDSMHNPTSRHTYYYCIRNRCNSSILLATYSIAHKNVARFDDATPLVLVDRFDDTANRLS